MAKKSRAIRLFISSTFRDFERERNLLSQEAFPRIRERCERRGFSFQWVDLRWGVSETDSANHLTMRICLDEIDRCIEQSPGVNFVVLAGGRYGTSFAPAEIPASDWEDINRDGNLSAKDWNFLNERYRRDFNAIGGPYRLIVTNEDRNKRAELERRIQGALFPAARKALSKERFGVLYGASATEQEIEEGLFRQKEGWKHTVAALREPSSGDDEPKAAALRERLREKMEKEGAIPPVCLTEGEADYEKKFLQMMEQRVGDAVERYMRLVEAEETALSPDELERQTLLDEYEKANASYWDNGNAMRSFSEFLEKNRGRAVLVSGETGSGKTALLKTFAYRESAAVAAVFCDIQPRTMSMVLNSLMRQLKGMGHLSEAPEPGQDDWDAIPLFERALNKNWRLPRGKRPVVAILDAVELIEDYRHQSDSLFRLKLPKWLTLAVSCVSKENLTMEEQRRSIPEFRVNLVTRKAAIDSALPLLLRGNSKTLTYAQIDHLLSWLPERVPFLYLSELSEMLRPLASYDNPPQELSSPPPDSKGMAERLLQSMRYTAAPALYQHLLGFLALSSKGLSEEEILSLLARDRLVIEELLSHEDKRLKKLSGDTTSCGQNPVELSTIICILRAHWTNLRRRMNGALLENEEHGVPLFRFRHNLLRKAALNLFAEPDKETEGLEPYEGREPYIVISYARKDAERMMPLLNALRRAGYRVWYDKGIPLGAHWIKTFVEKLEPCAIFCPLFSKAFNASRHCLDETAYAYTVNKPIVPIYLEELKLDDLRPICRFLSTRQSLMMYQFNSVAQLAERLKQEQGFKPCKADPDWSMRKPSFSLIPQDNTLLYRLAKIMRDYFCELPIYQYVESESGKEELLPSYRWVAELYPILDYLGEYDAAVKILSDPRRADAYIRAGQYRELLRELDIVARYTIANRELSEKLNRIHALLLSNDALFRAYPDSFLFAYVQEYPDEKDLLSEIRADAWIGREGGQTKNVPYSMHIPMAASCAAALSGDGIVAMLQGDYIRLYDMDKGAYMGINYRLEVREASTAFLYWQGNELTVRFERSRQVLHYSSSGELYLVSNKPCRDLPTMDAEKESVLLAGGYREMDERGYTSEMLFPYHIGDNLLKAELFYPLGTELKIFRHEGLAAVLVQSTRLDLLELSERKLLAQWKFPSAVYVRFSPDGRRLIVCTADNLIIPLDMPEEAEESAAPITEPSVSLAAYSRSYNLAEMRRDLQVTTAILEPTYRGNLPFAPSGSNAHFGNQNPIFACMSVKRNWLACYYYRRNIARVRLFRLSTRELLAECRVPPIFPEDAQRNPFYAEGEGAVILRSRGIAHRWDLQTGRWTHGKKECRRSLTGNHASGIRWMLPRLDPVDFFMRAQMFFLLPGAWRRHLRQISGTDDGDVFPPFTLTGERYIWGVDRMRRIIRLLSRDGAPLCCAGVDFAILTAALDGDTLYALPMDGTDLRKFQARRLSTEMEADAHTITPLPVDTETLP